MDFKQRHPYLFWQLVGWGILLADFVLLVVFALCGFGEWCYPIVVFTFIGGLFAVAASPFVVRYTRKRDVPQNNSDNFEKVIRSKISAINLARKKGHEVLAAFSAFFSIIGFMLAAYILGDRVHIVLGFACMPLAMIAPFVIWGAYTSASTKRFFSVKSGEKLIDIYHIENLRSLLPANPRTFIMSGEPNAAMLNFIYNWLRFYLKTERLELYRIPAPDLCVCFQPAEFLSYEDILICIPEEQLDLTKEKAALFKRECDIMMTLPFSCLVKNNNSVF